MKNKKILLIFFLMFLITGCTVDYELDITNEVVDENITIIDYDESKWDLLQDLNGHDPLSYRDSINIYNKDDVNIYVTSDNTKTYDKELINEGALGIKLKTNYNINEFNKHTYIGNCYKYFNVKNDGDVYTLSTSKVFMCFGGTHPLLDQVNVKIRVNNEVIDSNADSHGNNVYTWNITKENANNKQIILSYKRDKTIGEKIRDLSLKDDKISIAIIIIFFGVVVCIGIYIFIKNKKNNEI